MIKQRHTKQNGRHLNRCATESCQTQLGLTMAVDSAGKIYFLCSSCSQILNMLNKLVSALHDKGKQKQVSQ